MVEARDRELWGQMSTRVKSESSVIDKDQEMFVAYKTTSAIKWQFKNSATPLYHSSVTFLLSVWSGGNRKTSRALKIKYFLYMG